MYNKMSKCQVARVPASQIIKKHVFRALQFHAPCLHLVHYTLLLMTGFDIVIVLKNFTDVLNLF